MIRVFNTLSRTKEDFIPVAPGKVGIYLCGPTVYKPSHIGHMVGPVIFDTIKKYLVYSGYDVTFVVNITDVDDKLIKESNERKTPMAAIAAEMTDDYGKNLAAMGVDSIDAFPKATEHIDGIIRFTQDLIDKGFAYESNGDVYFAVEKFADYGRLSNRTLAEMTGEGGGTANRKASSFDFALWKSAKPDEPAWDSPWGKGRPGWHIECSVMSCALLGETFDIHGGGLDLQFPHHENEIAQSQARHNKPMAKYWMHNGLMQASSEVGKLGGRKTRSAHANQANAAEKHEAPSSAEVAAKEGDLASQEGGKISKSKGASAFRDMLAEIPAERIRFFLLSTHYRRPIDFSEERVADVGKGLETFYRFFKRFELVTKQSFYALAAPKTRAEANARWSNCDALDTELGKSILAEREKFLASMDDDFNTGGAIGVLFDLLRLLNRFVESNKLEAAASDAQIAELVASATVLKEITAILGVFREAPAEEKSDEGGLTETLMAILIELRLAAKKNKDFATADKIRSDLAAAGVVLEDRPGGTVWSRG